MDDSLKGKVALISGAGSGLGEATAHVFARAGIAVACADINRAAAERVSGDLAAQDVESIALDCDVSDAARVTAVVDAVVERFGRLDIVVNSAAIDHTVAIADMSVEQWDQVIAVNLRGPFLIARAALPVMRRQRSGHIINIA